MILEQMGFIEEIRYTGELDGYEDEQGNFHLIKNDYWFKTGQGEWYLKSFGRILVDIRSLFNSAQDFYELLPNKNISLLE